MITRYYNFCKREIKLFESKIKHCPICKNEFKTKIKKKSLKERLLPDNFWIIKLIKSILK